MWLALAYISMSLLSVCAACAQQHPFVLISGPNSPKGCLFPFQDSKGRLWLAGCETGQEGVYVFDGLRFLSPEGPVEGTGFSGMVEDTSGGIWLASTRGLFRVSQGKIVKVFDGIALAGITNIAPDVFLLSMKRQDGITVDAVRVSRSGNGWRFDSVLKSVGEVKFRMDASGNVLYGCNDGYCEISAAAVVRWGQGERLTVRSHTLGTGQQYMRRAAVVLRDRHGCVWLRDNTTVLYQCGADGPVSRLSSGEVGNGVPLLYELDDGSILIPSFVKIAIGRPGKMQITSMTTHGLVIPLRDGGLLAVAIDGLAYLPRRISVEYWSDSDGLGGNTWSVFRQGQNMYALADETAYVLEKDRKRWDILKGSVESIAPGNGGTVFVASGGAVERIAPDGRIVERSKAAGLRKVFHLRNDTVWASGDAIYEIEDRGGGLQLKSAGNYPQDAVQIESGPDGSVWACGVNGLFRRDRGEWQSVVPKYANLGCMSMTIEAGGRVRYVSQVNALTLLIEQQAGKPSIVEAYQSRDETAASHFIAADKRGWIWRGSVEALSVADPKQIREDKWLKLGRTDGLPTLDTNRNSFFEDSDGSIWYGADNDIIHLSVPADFLHPSFAPAVAISGLSSGDQPLDLNQEKKRFAGNTSLTAHFGSMQFDRRESLHLRYRVLPGKAEWRETNSLDILLGQPGWGTHTLQLEGQIGDGPWSTPAEQSFIIAVPLALTWPALGTYLMAGAGLGFAGKRWQNWRRAKLSREFPELARWRMTAISPEVNFLDGALLEGRFRVGFILARGGFAVIVEGRDESRGNERCALKIFRHDLFDQDWIRHRFEHEVKALEKICHPNVVRIYGHGVTTHNGLYIAMEFVEGVTLRAMMDSGPISRDNIPSYFRQVGEALDVIHRNGICHRDVKPENLMIRFAAAPGEELVLIDFSIAIVKDPDKTVHGLSRAAGTISYMAPEQAIGYADPATDIYSLTKVFIEMITGTRLADLLPNASMDLPLRVQELLTTLSIGLSDNSIALLSRALEFDPARRPKNAREFTAQIAADLESMNRAHIVQ